MSSPTTELRPDHPGVVAHPPFIYLGTLALAIALGRVVPLPSWKSPWLTLLGWIVVLGSGSFALWARKHMVRAGTNIKPTKPTTALVVTGPFRYTRNPLYLSLTLLYTGIALLAHLTWAMILLPFLVGFVTWGVIMREERYLDRKFGEIYGRYKEVTRRWI